MAGANYLGAQPTISRILPWHGTQLLSLRAWFWNVLSCWKAFRCLASTHQKCCRSTNQPSHTEQSFLSTNLACQACLTHLNEVSVSRIIYLPVLVLWSRAGMLCTVCWWLPSYIRNTLCNCCSDTLIADYQIRLHYYSKKTFASKFYMSQNWLLLRDAKTQTLRLTLWWAQRFQTQCVFEWDLMLCNLPTAEVYVLMCPMALNIITSCIYLACWFS